MADTAAAPAPTAAPKPEETSTPAVEVRATTADVTTDGVAAAPKEDDKPETTGEGKWWSLQHFPATRLTQNCAS